MHGVGFRAFVYGEALHLGVCGEVWNARDGTVMATAQHEEKEVLERLAERIWEGPGSVSEVISTEAAPGPKFERFSIRPSR